MANEAGLVIQRRSRETKQLVSLYDGELAGMDTDEGRWQTVCEKHSTICSHKTQALARYHLGKPTQWCEECRAELESGVEDWSLTYKTQTLEVQTVWGESQHLIIERRDGGEITATWDVLQQIKDEILGADVLAVELYPASQHVVNEVNRRHLWTVPDGLLSIGFHHRGKY